MKHGGSEENSLEKNKVYKLNVCPNIIDIVGVINDRNGEVCQMTRNLQKIDDIYALYKNQEIEFSKHSNRNIIRKPIYSPGVKFSLKKNIKDVLAGEFDVRDIKKFTSSILKKTKTRNHKNNIGYNGTETHSPERPLEYITHAFTDRNHLNTISHNDKSFFKTQDSKNSNHHRIYPSSLLEDYFNSNDKDLDPSMYALMHDKDYSERRSIILSLKKKIKTFKKSRNTSPCKNSSYEYNKAISNDENEKIEKQNKILRQKTFYKSPYFGEIEVDRYENNHSKDNTNKLDRQKTFVKSPYFGEIEVDRIQENETGVKIPDKKENFNLSNKKPIHQGFSMENSDTEKSDSRKTSIKKKISFLNQHTIINKINKDEQNDSELNMSTIMSHNSFKKKSSILKQYTLPQRMNFHEIELIQSNESIDKSFKKNIIKNETALLKSLITENVENVENEEKLDPSQQQLILPNSLTISPIKLKNSSKKLSDNSSLISEESKKNLIDLRPYVSTPEEFKINQNSGLNSIKSHKSDLQMPRILIPTNGNTNFNIESCNEIINSNENFTKNENSEYYNICPTSNKTRSSSHNSSILKFKEELPSIFLNCKNIEKENKKIYGNLSRLNLKADKIIRNIKEKSQMKNDVNKVTQNLLNSSALSVNNSKNVFIYGQDQGHYYKNFNLLENSLSKIKDDFLHRVKSAIKGRLDINEKNIEFKKTNNKHKKVENILNSIDIIHGNVNKNNLIN